MLSKKTRYAIIALIRLAKESGKGAILISDIAESEHIPQRFLELILVELKKLGILGSKLGKSGGYFLIKEPSEVNLWAIVRHFEGPIALVACISEKAHQPCEFCKDEATCSLRLVFKEIRDNTYSILKRTTLKDLVDPL
jgi:Rrf2 family protein